MDAVIEAAKGALKFGGERKEVYECRQHPGYYHVATMRGRSNLNVRNGT